MSWVSVWKRVLGVEHTVIESVEFEGGGDAEVVVARVRPARSRRGRCGRCGRRCPGYDQGEGRRRWRALDLGTVMAFVEADAPRVSCPEHGVVVAAVPWARPGSRFTRSFEDQCAWLTAHASASTVAELLRTTWRTVTGIVTRVVSELAGQVDQLEGLRRIGIDEIAHRKGQRYLTIVTNHDTGRIVWARKGRDIATVEAFFDDHGPQRAKLLTHVSADGAEWIHTPVKTHAPNAKICLDPFHIVQWATEALDEVRRQIVRDLKAAGRKEDAAALKGSRWALLKNPKDLSGDQRTTVASISQTNRPLYRAYMLKEQLRMSLHHKGRQGRVLLAGWLAWARRSRLEPFVKLARTIERYRTYILNTLRYSLSNARSEATNTHLRVLTRRAYGYHSAEALIAMAMLTRGGLCPPLPGR